MYTKHETVKISDLRKHTAEVLLEIEKLDHPVTVFSHSQPKVMIASCQWFKPEQPKAARKKKSGERHGIDFFADPPEEFLIKGKGLDAVKAIRELR